MSPFKRVTGALADVKELEYIAALHQTCAPDTRSNGTVGSYDVQRFLVSRYGLDPTTTVTHGQAVTVTRSLGGGLSQAAMRRVVAEKKRTGFRLNQKLATIAPSKISFRHARQRGNLADLEEGDEVRSESDDLQVPLDASSNHSRYSGSDSNIDNNNFKGSNNSSKIENKDNNNIVDEIPEEYLDLVQILAILLIPTLARAGAAYCTGGNQAEPGEGDENESLSSSSSSKTENSDPLQSLDPQPTTMIADAVTIMLQNVFLLGDTDNIDGAAPVLDEALVEALLLEVGEYERAQNVELIQEMVQAATSPGTTGFEATSNGRLFNAATLATALTSDLKAWKIESEDRYTTYWDDVHGDVANAHDNGNNTTPKRYDNVEDVVEEDNMNVEEGATQDAIATTKIAVVAPQLQPELSSIDYAVDSHTSLVIVGIIWSFYVMVSRSVGRLVDCLLRDARCWVLKCGHVDSCSPSLLPSQ